MIFSILPALKKWKMLAVGIILSALLTLSGILYFQKQSLETDILEKQQKISVLESENSQLKSKILHKDFEKDLIVDQYNSINSIREQSNAQNEKIENSIFSPARQNQVKRIVKGGKVELLLRKERKWIDCNYDNYGRVGGGCIDGKWREGR